MGPLLTVTQILRHIWMHIPVAMWSFGIYKPGYHAATFNGDKLQSSLYHGVPGRQYVKVAIATKKIMGFRSKKRNFWVIHDLDKPPEPLTTCVTPQSAEVGCQRPVI